jgi:riboflavin kinase/FMN adenylyltransferase
MSERCVTPAPITVDELSPGERIVTIGTFDGVHRGHQRLLEQAVRRGEELRLPVTGVTFEPVPAAVLRPEAFGGRISTPEEKLARLAEAGLDEIVIIPFTLELSRHSPEEFMSWLKEKIGLRELWVGEEFALGRDRTGTVERLAALGAELGFRVVAVPRLTNGTEVVSSSRVRSAVMNGDVATARRLLGRPFRVSGDVVHGQHLGRQIGFPTANVPPPPDLAPLADGIYAAWAWLPTEEGPRPAVAYIGNRPTVHGVGRMVETHVLDFDGDLYDQTIATDFIERIRPDATFPSIADLVAQMKLDKERAWEILASDDWGGRRALLLVLALPVHARVPGMPRVVLMGLHAAAVVMGPARDMRRRRVRLGVLACRRRVDRATPAESREQEHEQGTENDHPKRAHSDTILSGLREDASATAKRRRFVWRRAMRLAKVVTIASSDAMGPVMPGTASRLVPDGILVKSGPPAA